MDKKYMLMTVAGTIGSGIAYLFGGWSTDLITLLIFMGIDFVTGLIVAGIFHKSNKSENGALESHSCFKGLARKVLILALVLIGYRLDLLIGTDYIKTAIVIAFIVNELISITENAGLMGIPIPNVIMKAIDILKGDDSNGETGTKE